MEIDFKKQMTEMMANGTNIDESDCEYCEDCDINMGSNSNTNKSLNNLGNTQNTDLLLLCSESALQINSTSSNINDISSPNFNNKPTSNLNVNALNGSVNSRVNLINLPQNNCINSSLISPQQIITCCSPRISNDFVATKNKELSLYNDNNDNNYGMMC